MSRVRVRSPQDLGAAAVFVAIGICGLVFGQELAFGDAAKMGPGYFPTILSSLIIALGAGLLLQAFTIDGPKIERPQFRPIFFIVIAILAFGFLLKWLGLLITAVVMTVIAGYAGRKVNLRENLWLGVGMAIFTALVFVVGLSQPLPLWWGN